jgi:hypothetical protein
VWEALARSRARTTSNARVDAAHCSRTDFTLVARCCLAVRARHDECWHPARAPPSCIVGRLAAAGGEYRGVVLPHVSSCHLARSSLECPRGARHVAVAIAGLHTRLRALDAMPPASRLPVVQVQVLPLNVFQTQPELSAHCIHLLGV